MNFINNLPVWQIIGIQKNSDINKRLWHGIAGITFQIALYYFLMSLI